LAFAFRAATGCPAGAAAEGKRGGTVSAAGRRCDPANANACYVLAAMLERKKILKQIQTEERDRGRVLIYEHVKNGDVFVVPDPQLHLDQLEPVQNEVARLLML
jgi:hypothetical protein